MEPIDHTGMTADDRQAIIDSLKSAIKAEQAPPKELYAALAKATLAFTPITKDREAKVNRSAEKGGGLAYTFQYAGLDNVLAAVRKGLAENGLVLIQRIVPKDGSEFVETRLAHDSGESITNLTKMIVTEAGQVGYAKAQSFARRYGVNLLLCLAAEDDDDAGNSDGEATHRNVNTDEPVVTSDRRQGPLAPDPEVIDEYGRRIISLLDNQDPDGAAELYNELNQDEQMLLWRKGGLTMKQKKIVGDHAKVLTDAKRKRA